MVMSLGNVKDEHYFYTLSFMKSKLQPTKSSFGFGCLHKSMIVWIPFFWGHMKDWVENKVRYVVDC